MANFKPVYIPEAKDHKELGEVVQHQVNMLVNQLNATANKFTHGIDAQGNTITNIPTPTQAGDAVPLKYLQKAISEYDVKLQNQLNRRVKPYLPPAFTIPPNAVSSKLFTIIFKAAIAQSGTPLLGMSFPSSTVVGTVVSSGNTLFALANFTGGNYCQDHFPLPDDWIANSAIDLNIYWATASGTAAPTWSCALQGVPNGSSLSAAYNSASTVAGTATTSVQLVTSTLTNITNTGIAAGQLLMFKFGRSDGGTDNAGLVELRFTIRRLT